MQPFHDDRVFGSLALLGPTRRRLLVFFLPPSISLPPGFSTSPFRVTAEQLAIRGPSTLASPFLPSRQDPRSFTASFERLDDSPRLIRSTGTSRSLTTLQQHRLVHHINLQQPAKRSPLPQSWFTSLARPSRGRGPPAAQQTSGQGVGGDAVVCCSSVSLSRAPTRMQNDVPLECDPSRVPGLRVFSKSNDG